MRNFSDDFIYVEGGDTRQNSIKNALKFVDTPYVMISDVARACIPQSVIKNLLDEKENADYNTAINKFNENRTINKLTT